jgi:hypothetical protein
MLIPRQQTKPKKLTAEERAIQRAKAHLSMAPVGSKEHIEAKKLLSKIEKSSQKVCPVKFQSSTRPVEIQRSTRKSNQTAQPSKKDAGAQVTSSWNIDQSKKSDRAVANERILSPLVKQYRREETPQKTAIRHTVGFDDDDFEDGENKSSAELFMTEDSQSSEKNPKAQPKKYKTVIRHTVGFDNADFEDGENKPNVELFMVEGSSKPKAQPKESGTPETVRFPNVVSSQVLVLSPGIEQKSTTGTPQFVQSISLGSPSKPQQTILCSPDTKVLLVNETNRSHFVVGGDDENVARAPKAVAFELPEEEPRSLSELRPVRSRMSTPHPKKAKSTPSPALMNRASLLQEPLFVDASENEEERLLFDNENNHKGGEGINGNTNILKDLNLNSSLHSNMTSNGVPNVYLSSACCV